MLKGFTFFEHATISLLFLLRTFFREFHAFKPCTSKEGNSEVYFLAIGYRRTEETVQFVNVLKHHIFEK